MKKRLLIVTQALNLDDSVLGVYHDWLLALAAGSDEVTIICLTLGRHQLPPHVRVFSLGKEKGRRSRFSYAFRFLQIVWRERTHYDRVFVHMNQEYVLIAGWLWALLGKPIYFWRNHGKGSGLTVLAGLFSRKVFATSTKSYTASFRNGVRMPVGVDLATFATPMEVSRVRGSVLMVGRIAPSKHVREVVDALAILSIKGTHLALTLVGETLSAHTGYLENLRQLAESAHIGLSLRGGVPHAQLAHIYAEHDIVVNVSDPGMFDKTILEALASGCLLLTRHEDLSPELDPMLQTDGTPRDIADKIAHLVLLPELEREAIVEKGREIADQHRLETLMARLSKELYA